MALRPQPRFPEPDTELFWEATKKKELKFQVCDDCEEIIFIPVRIVLRVVHWITHGMPQKV